MYSTRKLIRFLIPFLDLIECFRSFIRPQYRHCLIRIPASSPLPKFQHGQKVKVNDTDSLHAEGTIAFIHPLNGDEYFCKEEAYMYGVRYLTRDGIDVQIFSESSLLDWNR